MHVPDPEVYVIEHGEYNGARWAWIRAPWESVVADGDVFDHVITDPPYTEHVQAHLLSATKTKGKAKKHAAGFAAIGDALGFVPTLRALAARWAIFHCAVEQLGPYKEADPDHWVRSGIYCKTRATPQLTGDRPGNRCEGIAIFHASGKKRWNGGGKHAFWLARPENRSQVGHPTGKPLALCRQIIEQFTDPGETIFDPFGGIASYGVAALLLGRHYVGCEIQPEGTDYWERGLANLKDPRACLKVRGGEKAWEIPEKKEAA